MVVRPGCHVRLHTYRVAASTCRQVGRLREVMARERRSGRQPLPAATPAALLAACGCKLVIWLEYAMCRPIPHPPPLCQPPLPRRQSRPARARPMACTASPAARRVRRTINASSPCHRKISIVPAAPTQACMTVWDMYDCCSHSRGTFNLACLVDRPLHALPAAEVGTPQAGCRMPLLLLTSQALSDTASRLGLLCRTSLEAGV